MSAAQTLHWLHGFGVHAALAPRSAPGEEPAVRHENVSRPAPANRQEALQQLRSDMQQLDCPLKTTAMNLVFADGVEDAPVMVVGEAPGSDEDRQGKPFVGASGKLLDKMLACIGLSREKNVYITNVLPWRPPGNRTPTDSEISLCLPLARRHIAIMQPKVVLLCGGIAAKSLLESKLGIMKLRGRWTSLTLEGCPAPIPALASYHPAFLLRSPLQKRLAWQDLQALQQTLRDAGLDV